MAALALSEHRARVPEQPFLPYAGDEIGLRFHSSFRRQTPRHGFAKFGDSLSGESGNLEFFVMWLKRRQIALVPDNQALPLRGRAGLEPRSSVRIRVPRSHR